VSTAEHSIAFPEIDHGNAATRLFVATRGKANLILRYELENPPWSLVREAIGEEPRGERFISSLVSPPLVSDLVDGRNNVERISNVCKSCDVAHFGYLANVSLSELTVLLSKQ
jgi:hypothetical protein